jgi:poly(A) polymerase Pap1
MNVDSLELSSSAVAVDPVKLIGDQVAELNELKKKDQVQFAVFFLGLNIYKWETKAKLPLTNAL